VKAWLAMLVLAVATFAVAYPVTGLWNASPAVPPGMVWIPGGGFTLHTTTTPHQSLRLSLQPPASLRAGTAQGGRGPFPVGFNRTSS
jgi:hypothetical protein